MDAYKEARHSERTGDLMDAREFWMKCAQPRCNAFLQERCGVRAANIDGDIPSVVLAVNDAGGSPRADVQVDMDGSLLMRVLDGRARNIDPGMHDFSFRSEGRVFAARKIMVVQGQRNRLITVELPSGHRTAKTLASSDQKASTNAAIPVATTMPEASDNERSDGSSAPPKVAPPKLPFVLGGVGVAAMGTALLLTLWGRQDNAALSQCSTPDAPGLCQQSAVDHVKKLYLAANISLGVGVAALVGAYALYARSRPAVQESPASDKLSFNLQPTRTGAVASVGGAF